MNTTATAWAGLGLFFIGMRLVGAHLQQWAGGSIRALLARTLSRPWVPPLAGLLSGAATQSTSASTFIAAGLVSAGAASVATTLPLLAWANVGTSALVLLAATDLSAVVYWLLALIGIGFFWGLEQQARFRHLLLALLGLALLMLGLGLLKGGISELRSNPWTHEFLQFAGEGAVSSFLLGFILATAVQSSSIVAVLALPLAHEGLLGLPELALMVYGANLGSGFAVLLLASGMEGTTRQLALCQALLRVLATVALLLLFAVERVGEVPLVLALLEDLAPGVARQSSLVYLVFQLAVVAVAVIAAQPLTAATRRLSPAVELVSHLQPEFLFDDGVDDPETALSLVRLEQQRLVRALPEFLDDLRPASERPPAALPLRLRRQASAAVTGEIDAFLSATLRANPDMKGVERVFDARVRLKALQALQDCLYEFAGTLAEVAPAERPPLVGHLVEGLHAVLGVAGDATDDPEAAAMLAVLTDDRGALMDRVRAELLGGARGIAGREALLAATLLFERALWMLRQATLLEGAGTAAEPGQVQA